MITTAQRLISPTRALWYSFIICIIFTSIPPPYYEKLIGEPNYMFFDPLTITFVTISLLSVWLGIAAYRKAPKIKIKRIKTPKIIVSRNTYFLIPMLFSIVVSLYMDFDLLSHNSLLFILVLNGLGDEVKTGLSLNPLFFQFLYFNIGITLWVFYRCLQLRFNFLLKSLTYFMILLIIATAFIIVARYILLPFIIALGVIYISNLNPKISKNSLYLKLGLIVILIVALFVVLGLIRGGEVMYGIVAYGPSSFNRLTAFLNGMFTLDVPKIYYMFSFFKNDWTYHEIIMNEHDAVTDAGLVWSFNWITAYGNMFYSMGYMMFLYLFFLGFFTAFTWRSFLQKKSWAVVFYPWLFMCILLWFSYHILGYSQTYIILLTGVALNFYNNLFFIRGKDISCSHS